MGIKKITEVDTVASLNDDDKVFINQNGTLKQVDKDLLNPHDDTKLDKNQGEENIGKYLKITGGGIISPVPQSDIIDITAPIKEVKGSLITADGTAQGSAIAKEIRGGTKQETTQGWNLFDASKIPTTSAGGANLTNNGDGSLTVSGSGNLSSVFNSNYKYATLPDFFTEGTYTIDGIDDVYPSCEVNITNQKDGTVIKLLREDRKKMIVTSEDIQNLQDGTYVLILYVYGSKDRAIRTGTIKPFVYKETEPLTEWEPFTGGAPSPSPDYPQEIKAIGGNGWFDGEMKNGYYGLGSAGKPIVFTLNDSYRCCKVAIPCKANDMIDFKISEENQYMYIIAIDENSNGLKSFTKENNSIDSKHIKATMPSGSKAFVVYYGGANFKECDITVIVNDKYAVKVKTTGKNLIDINSKEKNNGNSTDEVYGESIKVISNGKGSPTVFYNLGDVKDYIGKTLYLKCDEIIKSNPNMFPKIIIKSTKNNQTSVKDILICDVAGQEVTVKVPSDLGEANTISLCVYASLSTAYETGNYAIFKNIMLSEESIEDYQKYKESVALIPLDYPLYEGDKLYLEDGELWEYRENARVVFDGSADEMWNTYTNANSDYISFYTHFEKTIKRYKTSLCDKYKNENNIWSPPSDGSVKFGVYSDNETVENKYFRPPNAEVETLAQWKTWLRSNQLEVVYKLATPTRKKLGSAEAFNLRTFDGVTYIEVVGSKELGTENTFIVPKNQSGGIMTDAFATAKRNEINMAEQANIVSRISALEQLAVREG